VPEPAPSETWIPQGPSPAALPLLRSAIQSAALGAYAQALDAIARIESLDDPGSISAASALRASILRQLHQHEQAHHADLRALDHAVGHPSSDTRIDALAGLVADAIGEPQRALEQWALLEPLLPRASIRARVRAGWVGAEVHLAADQPRAALDLARRSADLATDVSPRHEAKSLLVLGVCQVAVGEQAGGMRAVRRATVLAASGRLRPLLWPGAYLLGTWLPEPEGGRWRRWSQDVVASIASGLPADLRSGWQSDPAVRALLESRASGASRAAGSLWSHEQ
jgi:hypothetical protein